MKYDKPTLKSNINTDLADNATQQISPNDVRHNLLDIIDSVHSISYTSGTELFTSNFATPDLRSTKAGRETLSKLYLDGYSSTDNSAFGYSALAQNYDGQRNTGAGSYALSCNVYGSNNTAIGYNSLAGNIRGSGNVGLGPHTLRTNKDGMFNIAVGHGAGYFIGSGASYKFFLGSYDVDDDSLCGEGATSGTNPLLYGELDNLRLGVGVQSLHDYGNLQVSGSVSPALSGQFDLGHQLYPWSAAHISDSINDDIYFSGGYLGIGTASPSGTEGLVTVGGTVVPNYAKAWDLGRPDLMWRGGYFENIVVSGTAAFDVFTYREIESCLYECRTLYLATSGICEGNAPCGYLTDESLEGAGLVVPSSGTDYTRNYKWIFQAPDSTLTCLEQDTPNSRASWHSNISLDVASGSHVRADRILGRENLSLVSENNCFGIFIKKDDQTVRTGTASRNEKQKIIVDATGGTFTLTFGGQTTSALAFNATAAEIQAALRALSSIGDGNVTASGYLNSTSGVTIEFTGTLAGINHPTITGTSSLTKAASSSSGGEGNRKFYISQDNTDDFGREQLIKFRETGLVTGGTFTIKFSVKMRASRETQGVYDRGGYGSNPAFLLIETLPIPWNATVSEVADYMNAAVRNPANNITTGAFGPDYTIKKVAVQVWEGAGAGTGYQTTHVDWSELSDADKRWYRGNLYPLFFHPPSSLTRSVTSTFTSTGGTHNRYKDYPHSYAYGSGLGLRFSNIDNHNIVRVGCNPNYPIHARTLTPQDVNAQTTKPSEGGNWDWYRGVDAEIEFNAGHHTMCLLYTLFWPLEDGTIEPMELVDSSNLIGGSYSHNGGQIVSNRARAESGNNETHPTKGAPYILDCDGNPHKVTFAIYDVDFDASAPDPESLEWNKEYAASASDYTNGAPTATITTFEVTTMSTTAEVQAAFDTALGAGKVKVTGAQQIQTAIEYSDNHDDEYVWANAVADGKITEGAGHEQLIGAISYNPHLTANAGGGGGVLVKNWNHDDHDRLYGGGMVIEFLGADMQNKWINTYFSGDPNESSFKVIKCERDGEEFGSAPHVCKTETDTAFANKLCWGKSLLGGGVYTGDTPSLLIHQIVPGATDITSEVNKTAAMFIAEEADITPNPIGPDGTVAGITDVNFIGGSGADDNDYVVTYSSLTSGVVVGQRLITRSSNKTQTNELDNLTGFTIDFIDTKDAPYPQTQQSKDRLSIAGYNNNPFALNALTIMKSNFPGLVGITNYPDIAADILPETIFNIQATGEATVRVTAGHDNDSAVQILSGSNTECENGNPQNGFETVYVTSGDYKFTDLNTYEDCNKCTAMRIHGCKVGVGLPSGHLPEYTFHIAGDYPKLGLQTTGSTRDGYIYSKPTSETLADGTVRTCDHLWWHSNCGDVQLSTQRTQDHVNITNLVGRQDLIAGGETAMTNGGVGEHWDVDNPYGGDSSSDIYMGDDYIDLAGNSMGQMAGLGRGNFGGASQESHSLDGGGFDDLMGNIDGINGATNNTGQGFGAVAGLTTGSSNTAFGAAAGASTSVGSCNTFVGVNAGRNVTTGNRNVAVGCEALYTSHADVDYNIFIGTKLPQNSNNDWVLQIGHGPETPGTLIPGPILSGSLGPAVADKHLFVLNKLTVPNINNTDAITFDHDQNLFGTDKVASVIQKDDNSSDYPDGGVAFRFKGANGDKNDLMTLRHHVEPMTRVSSFNTPSPERPVVEVKGDLNVLGAIRFHDGTSLESGVGVSILPGSGLGSFLNSNGETEFKLDVEDLPTAPVLSTSGSYIAVGTSGNTQRVSLLELDQQLSSGANYILANHNHAVTNTSDINTSINSYTNLMGYRAGDDIIQSNYSVFIGPEAGANDGNAVSGSYSSAFIGHRAGMNAGSADNSVFMGPNAGHNASGSRMSVFVGNSAGLNAKSSRSVGIGDNALEAVSGDRNIEITVGMGGADPYRLITGTTSNKLNVGDMIGGDMSTKRLSVGNATLSPSGTFDVRAPASGVGTLAPHVQTWWNHNGAMVAYLDHDGNMFIKGTVQTIS